MHNLNNKKVLVLGFARTGSSAANFLVERGAQVILNDQSDLTSNPEAKRLAEKGVHLLGGGHPLEILDQNPNFIVKNPGIPYQIDLLQEAMKKGIPIYTDIEIFSWFSPSPIIAITGSNGKTTTTSLTHAIFKMSGYPVELAGNIGIPSLEILDKLSSQHAVIMELSSFQLMGVEAFRPHIAAITNIFPAHLDYHGTEEAYIEAKLNIIDKQTQDDYLIINADHPRLVEAAKKGQAQVIPFASQNLDDWVKKEGLYIEEGVIYFKGQAVMGVEDVKIPGQHNLENVMVAIGIAKLMNLSNEHIREAVGHFLGVEYRIQPLGKFNGINIYNDSKATNPSATITALNSFNRPIIYIGGGLDRGIDFQEMSDAIQGVRFAFVYGESKDKLGHLFAQHHIPVEQYDSLKEASVAAFAKAESGEVVLFSPACASWDQYTNYEVRGQEFTDFVNQYFQ